MLMGTDDCLDSRPAQVVAQLLVITTKLTELQTSIVIHGRC